MSSLNVSSTSTATPLSHRTPHVASSTTTTPNNNNNNNAATRTIDGVFLSVDAHSNDAPQRRSAAMATPGRDNDDIDVDDPDADLLINMSNDNAARRLLPPDVTPIKPPSSTAANNSSNFTTPAAAKATSSSSANTNNNNSDSDETGLRLPLAPASAVDVRAERQLETLEFAALHLAKVYFDCKEFARVDSALASCRSLKALYFRLYTRFLLGEKLSGEEAFAKGLYTRLFDDAVLAEETMKAARRLTDGPRMGYRYMKANLNNAEDWAFEAALDAEALNMTLSTQATAQIWKAERAAKQEP